MKHNILDRIKQNDLNWKENIKIGLYKPINASSGEGDGIGMVIIFMIMTLFFWGLYNLFIFITTLF
jgi:hypothetical protein